MYMLFAGHNYYPGGGWNDFVGSFNSVHDAKNYLAESGRQIDWWHVACGSGIAAQGSRHDLPKIEQQAADDSEIYCGGY